MWRMGGMIGYWWIVPILFIGMFFFFYPRRRASFQHDYPEDIARRRYARGEITKEEYDDILNSQIDTLFYFFILLYVNLDRNFIMCNNKSMMKMH